MSDVIDIVKDGLKAQEVKLDAALTDLEAKMNEQVTLNGEAHEETKNAYKAIEETLISLKDRQDAYEKEAGRLKGGQPSAPSFHETLKSALQDNSEQLKEFQNSGRPFSFDMKDMTTKAVITMGDAYTNDVVPADYVNGIKYDPERRIRVRQFLPQGTTSSDKIRYIQESNFTDNTGVTAEGVASGQNDFDLTATDANVEKISAHFRVSKEALADTVGLASHISLRGSQKYMNEEDKYLLYDSTYGLTVTATDYTLDQYTGDANASEFDVIMQAISQLTTAEYQASGAMIGAARYYDMIRTKDANGRYVLPESVVFGTAPLRVAGVPIIPTTAINATNGNADDFLIADFAQLTTLFDRQGMTVRFYEQDQDNVTKDLVTVQISGRLALPTYLPNAGRYGRFGAAITNAGNS